MTNYSNLNSNNSSLFVQKKYVYLTNKK